MHQLLTTLFILSTLCSFAQDLKKVKNKPPYEAYTEEYYVLKADKSIRQGNYQKLGYKNNVLENGYYKNNQKDSTWTVYFRNSDLIRSQGNYKNDLKTGLWTEYVNLGKENSLLNQGEYKEGQRTGTWEFYNAEGEVIQRFDYSTGQLLYFKPDEDAAQKFEIKTELGTDSATLDRPPMHIGGPSEASNGLFAAKLSYPAEARDSGINGTVVISFFVGVDGKATDHEVKEGIGGGCDEEALRAVKQIPDRWIPGELDGKAVTARFLLPVRFTLR